MRLSNSVYTSINSKWTPFIRTEISCENSWAVWAGTIVVADAIMDNIFAQICDKPGEICVYLLVIFSIRCCRMQNVSRKGK